MKANLGISAVLGLIAVSIAACNNTGPDLPQEPDEPVYNSFAYVLTDASSVRAFSVNASTGTLTEIGGSPFATGPSPRAFAVHPTGKFAYIVSGSSGVFAYAINSLTGALTAIAGSPLPAGQYPNWVAADPIGRFVYVANRDSNNISVYTVNSST